MELVATRAAAIISRIVAGPSNSSVTLLPAMRGTPVACSSSAASAFRLPLALAQRRATRADACFGGSVPFVVAIVGVAFAGASGSTSGSDLHATTPQLRHRASSQANGEQ